VFRGQGHKVYRVRWNVSWTIERGGHRTGSLDEGSRRSAIVRLKPDGFWKARGKKKGGKWWRCQGGGFARNTKYSHGRGASIRRAKRDRRESFSR